MSPAGVARRRRPTPVDPIPAYFDAPEAARAAPDPVCAPPPAAPSGPPDVDELDLLTETEREDLIRLLEILDRRGALVEGHEGAVRRERR